MRTGIQGQILCKKVYASALFPKCEKQIHWDTDEMGYLRRKIKPWPPCGCAAMADQASTNQILFVMFVEGMV